MILAPDKNLTLLLLRETVHLKIKEHNEKRGYLPLLLFIINPSFITIIFLLGFVRGERREKGTTTPIGSGRKVGKRLIPPPISSQ